MALHRLIRRSFQNKLQNLRSNESHCHTLLQQQQYHTLIHPRTLRIPTSSAFGGDRRQFHNVTTVPNQQDETTLSSESPKRNTDIVTDEKDRWKGASTIIEIEGRTADDIWEKYIQLSEDPDVELTEYDYITVCVALKRDNASSTSIKRIQTLLRQIHERGDMPEVFVRCCNILIYVFLQQQDLDSARLVFDGLLRSKYQPTTVTVNTLIDGIGRLGTTSDAMALYHSLSRQGLFPNASSTYKHLIKVIGSDFGDVDASVAIFNKLQKNGGKDNTPTPNISLHNMMLTIYNNANQRERAWAFYCRTIMAKDSKVKPNLGTYHLLLTALQSMENGDKKKARIKTIYDDMARLGLKIAASHYMLMGQDPMEALKILKADGIQLNTNDYNILLAAAVKNNKFDDALTMFQEMQKGAGASASAGAGGDGGGIGDGNGNGDGDDDSANNSLQQIMPDVYTYGIIMDALVKDIEQPTAVVFDVYDGMKQHGIGPDVAIYSCLLQACSRDGDTQRAVDVLDEMQQFNVEPNTYIFNNFLGVLSRKPVKEKQDMYTARAILDQMITTGIYPDTRTYNQYLSLLSQFTPRLDPNEIKSSLSRMQQEDDQRQHQQLDDLFDDDNGSAPIGEIPMSGTAKYMMNVYRTMRRSNNKASRPDFVTYSILINTMVAQGQTRQAMLLFRDAQLSKKKIGINIYNNIMQGLLRDNDLNQILHLWQDMKANCVLPDRVSYDLVLDACEQLHLAESFTTIMQQRELDSDRLARLDDARERRWSRSKSIREQQQHHQQQHLGGDDQHGFD